MRIAPNDPLAALVERLASSARPVLVVGLDGGTWDVLAPLCRQGVMPHLEELFRRGSAAPLQSTTPWLTPVAWSTFLTGLEPQQHGIWDFFHLDHKRQTLVLNRSEHVRGETLLERFALNDREVVSIDLPMTWPPPVPGAWVLGGFDAPNASSALEAAPQFAAALERCGVPWLPQPRLDRVPQTPEELRAMVDECQRVMANRVQAAQVADSFLDWQLLIVQFQVLDGFQHRCWHHVQRATRQGTDSSPEAALCGRFFRHLDEQLGLLLQLAQRRHAAVVVLSDHGFGPNRGRINTPWQLHRQGLLQLARGWKRMCFRWRRWGWKLRRWHYKRLRGRKTRTFPRPVQSQFAWDWNRSLVFPLHGDLGTMLYLNDGRRFGRGRPLSYAQRRRLAEETIQGLVGFRCPETGASLWHTVLDVESQFQVDPVEHGWPDLVAVPTPGWNTLSARFVPRGPTCPEPELPGTHHPQGLFMLAGVPELENAETPTSPCRQGEPAQAQQHLFPFRSGEGLALRDVAPLVLTLAGLQPPQPPNRRQSAPAKRCALSPSSAAQLTAQQQEQIEHRLRSLGYLE